MMREKPDAILMVADSLIYCPGDELVEMKGTGCDPRAELHGKRPPGAQYWRRKQTIPIDLDIAAIHA
jgi:hypothetical protein